MPNWTSNELEITGPAAEVSRFVATVRGQMEDRTPIPLSFESVIPPPAGADDASLRGWSKTGSTPNVSQPWRESAASR